MAFYNKKTTQNNSMKRTVFNNIHESSPNPIRTYYTFLNLDGKDHYFEYQGKFRVEAEAHFREEARLHGAKYNGNLYTLKN